MPLARLLLGRSSSNRSRNIGSGVAITVTMPWQRPSLTYDPIDRAEDYGHDHEPSGPVVMVVHCGYSKEHEDDGLRATRQHLHGILDGGVRLVRDVRLHVVLHRDTAEGDPAAREVTANRRCWTDTRGYVARDGGRQTGVVSIPTPGSFPEPPPN